MTDTQIPELIAADTHPKEYLLHKYWSRKPSNVLAHFFGPYARKGSVLIDPFCGSGVSLLEGKRLGFTTYGFDINPIAAILSTVTTTPPTVEDFSAAVEPILEEFKTLCHSAYFSEENGSSIRYNVHEIIVKCKTCSHEVAFSDAVHSGRVRKCPSCGGKVHFNLKNLVGTHITKTVLEGVETASNQTLADQKIKSALATYTSQSNYDFDFVENRRILAFKGMTTRALFTERNFSLLTWFADQCHAINDQSIRETACLLLTASAAQCSRLTAFRNNMSTGGPAWSVPGFWVPPVHLETNPMFHLKARYTKFLRGLAALCRTPGKGTAHVECASFSHGIGHLKKKAIKADLVFLDPPYGDSVPFAEFSQIWNSFLKKMPVVDDDLSVSDRLPSEQAWSKYEIGLRECIQELAQVMKPAGVILVTFNNGDLRAWKALLAALQNNKFRCKYVGYQIPAVISSKAQFSVDGSYISDVYSVWEFDKNHLGYGLGMAGIIEALTRSAASRGGEVPKAFAQRIFMMNILENNYSYKCLDERDAILESVFDMQKNRYSLKNPVKLPIQDFGDIARTAATELLKQGPASWQRLYESVARSSQKAGIGIPDPNETKNVLSNFLLFNKDNCYLLYDQVDAQQGLFPGA